MLQKTKGIMIGYIPYRETSVIAKVYTEKFGIQSYIENGVRTSKGKHKIALFQPLNLLDLVVYHNQKKELHRISEMKCHTPLLSIPYDIRKSSIAIFLNEILNKTLKEHTENEALFFFLYQSILTLDEMKQGIENFHLIFLVRYSFFLGFAPHNITEIASQFSELGIPANFTPEFSKEINKLLSADFSIPFKTSKFLRTEILDNLLIFYKIHLAEFGEIKSLPVLHEVLNS